MTFPNVDRYADLVNSIVLGSFYSNKGIVLPYRNSETTLRIETDYINTEFGIYLNEIFVGTVYSDVVGNVVFRRLLPRGEVEITLVSGVDGYKIKTYVTVREYALWLASYAEALEVIDTSIIQASANSSIETAEISALEEIYGKPIGVYANSGQGIEAYRAQILELRQAYRSMGGQFGGINDLVSSFTQVPPFGYSRRKWGPNWVLDQDMLVNHRFLDRSHYLTNSTGNITGVDLVKVEPDVVSVPGVPHILFWDSVTRRLRWFPDGTAGTAVDVHDGELFLPGPNYNEFSFILGRSVSGTPYNIGPNNHIYLNIDNLGTIDITLVTGLPNPTPAQVVVDIIAALLADIKYGAPYAASATVYNAKVLIKSIVIGGSVEVENGVSNGDAEIFGVLPGDIKFAPIIRAGVTALNILGYFNIISDCFLQRVYDNTLIPPNSFRWQSPLGALGPLIPITEDGEYTLTDSIGNTLKIYVCIADISIPAVSPATETTQFSIGYSRISEINYQCQGLWVQVDTSSLPIANQTDTILVGDDVLDGFVETPDNFFITTSAIASSIFSPSLFSSKLDRFDPSSAFRWKILELAAPTTNLVITGKVNKFPLPFSTPRGRNYPQQISGMFYDYEGFEAKLSGWFSSLGAGTTTATLSFSFDGGDNWVSSTPTLIVTSAGGTNYESPTYVEFSTVIPSEIKYREIAPLTWEDSGVLVKVDFNRSVVGVDVTIDDLSVGVEYITSKSLQNSTVVRSRHRQKFGELLWIWSPEILTLNEQKYLGLLHKDISPNSIFGGITVSSISTDTNVGSGTFEYSYTSIGSIKRLRWQPYGTSFAPGVGWLTVIADGTYQLIAPDASSIDVEVIYSYLPNLVGTTPTIISARTLVISDNTVEQGQSRLISSAHSSIDIFDATEYTALGLPKNLFGAIDEADFSFCGLINCEIQSIDPIKYSYIYPEFLNQAGEQLALFLVGPDYVSTLAYYSDEDQTEAILYENGIPVPNDMWSFSAANTISIPQAWFVSGDLNLANVFTIDYNLIYQVTTTVLDLQATYRDYMWLADYYLWERLEKIQGEYYTETPLFFNASNSRAILTKRSNANKATSKLFVQLSQESVEIPKKHWQFVDDFTIEITASYLVNGQFYLQHYEPRVYLRSNLNVIFEHRSAASALGVLAATWNVIDKNENVNVHQIAGHRFHQLRLSVSGIRDLRDFRIRSLVLKGLHLYGTTPNVPGLTNNWTI